MSEKKIKARFNIIDVLIILVLAAVLWVFANYASVEPAQNNAAMVQYTVEIKGIREENVGAFAEGDEITGDKGGGVIGKIVSVGEYENETAITENIRTGEFNVSEIPNRYTVRLVIESPCVKNADGITVDNTDIKVGKSINIKTDKYVSKSTILEVKEG